MCFKCAGILDRTESIQVTARRRELGDKVLIGAELVAVIATESYKPRKRDLVKAFGQHHPKAEQGWLTHIPDRKLAAVEI